MEDMIAKARAKFKSGNLNDAVQTYKAVLKENPNDPIALQELAEALSRMGQHDEALHMALQAVRQNSGLAGPHGIAGVVYLRLKRYKEAESELRKAVELDASDAETYSNLGVVLLENGQVGEGISLLQKSIALGPDTWVAHYNLFTGYVKANRLFEAFREAWKAVRLHPSVGTIARILDYLEFTYRPIYAVVQMIMAIVFVASLPSKLAFLIPMVIVGYHSFIGFGFFRVGQKAFTIRRLIVASVIFVSLILAGAIRLLNFR